MSSGSLTVIGGAGLVIGSFVSGGTATPNFTRLAKNTTIGTVATVVAFFIGNSLMFFFGAISYIFLGGNDIFEVMIRIIGTILSVWLYYNFCNWLNVLNWGISSINGMVVAVVCYLIGYFVKKNQR